MLPTLNETPFAYLIVLTTIVVGIYALADHRFSEAWRFHPFGAFRGRRLHTVFTSIFIHVSLTHLIVNTVVLLIALPYIESMLVNDRGPVLGRFLLLADVSGTALLTGLMLAIRYRHVELRWFAGMSSVIWSQIFIYLLYDLVVPISDTSGVASDWLPLWIAASLLVVQVVLTRLGDPAGAPHLFGAMAGILFVILVRPEAVTEVFSLVREGHRSEKSDDTSIGHPHGTRHADDYLSDGGFFSSFVGPDQSSCFCIEEIHAPAASQRCFCVVGIHDVCVFDDPPPWRDTANIDIVDVN